MKKIVSILICILLLCSLCACKKNNTPTPTPTTVTEVTPVDGTIIGTWVSNTFGSDHYFIFDNNENAIVRWGTHSVQGEYDYDAESGEYDIEIDGYLYNLYTATFTDNSMFLVSDSASYLFTRADSVAVSIIAPDDLKADDNIVGKWNCADTFEQYVFNSDCTAYYMDMEYLYRVDFKFDCNDGKITFYSMSNNTNLEVNELEYTFENGKLKIGDYIFDPVQE